MQHVNRHETALSLPLSQRPTEFALHTWQQFEHGTILLLLSAFWAAIVLLALTSLH